MSQAGLRIIFVGGWGGEPRPGDSEILRAYLAALADVSPDVHPVVLGPDLSCYLLAADLAGKPPHRRLILRRLAVLMAAAEGRGAPPDAPGVAATIELLGSAHAVIDLAGDSLAGGVRRDALWSQAAAVYVAAARGVRVLVYATSIGAPEHDLDAVVLGRLLRSAALVSLSDPGTGSAAYARRLGAGNVVEGLGESAQLDSAISAAEARW